MDNRMQQYRILLYSRPEADGPPSSAVLMEITREAEKARLSFRNWKKSLASHKAPVQDSPANEGGFRISGGDEEDVIVSCSEEDILSTLLAWFCQEPWAVVKELCYQGHSYTDISLSDLRQIRKGGHMAEICIRICMRAKKDGHDTVTYFMGPSCNDNLPDLTANWAMEHDEDDAVDDADDLDDYLLENNVWYLGSMLSSGIVEATESQTYAGTCTYVTSEIHADGTFEHSRSVHLFLEINGSDLTFSVLLGGRLYRKISRDAEKVVFYHTPLDPAARECNGFRQGENPRDLIFRNTDGEYRFDTDLQECAAGFSGAVIIPPQTPDYDGLDTDLAHGLYEDYLRALYTAVSEAAAFKVQDGEFSRGEDGSLHAEIKGFLLTGNRFWEPADEDDFPADFQNFKESYDGEDLIGLIRVEKASFTETGTENRITLSPKDTSISREYTKDAGGDELLDFDLKPLFVEYQKDSSLDIEITGPEGNELYRGSFDELRKGNVFESVNLPETIQFSENLNAVMEDFKIYEAIRQGILNYSVRRIIDVFTMASKMNRQEMEALLYPNDEIPDDAVTALAMKMKRRFIRNGEIPNIALIGQAGTGKSTMIANLAKIFGKEVHLVSASDLKGAYLGQTAPKVVDLLIDVVKKGDILFIDEAYELMSDNFGREAVALLLPVISKDRTSITAITIDELKKPISIDFKKKEFKDRDGETKPYKDPGFPPIWIAGYEDEVRLMLGMNKGLYRRIERITLKTPSPEELYQALWKNLENLKQSMLPQDFGILSRQFRLNREIILKFFRWGTQPQNSRYFANYAGVINFLNNCVDGIDFTQTEEQITRQLTDIITSMKRDVKRQLDTVLRKGRKGEGISSYDDTELIHMVYDNKTRFDDLVGCDSQKEYMQSIIDMMKKKNKYDRLHMTIPKGALLLGQPGVGKTFIARAMAGELQAQFEELEKEMAEAADENEKRTSTRVGFMSLSAPELVSKSVDFIGSVFDKAEEYDVCVVFIDEVDAIAKRRDSNPHYSHFIELIRQMDGMEQRSNVFILAATNAPESLDPAFTRSGRIDKKLTFTLPDLDARRKLIRKNVVSRCEALKGFFLKTDAKGQRRLEDEDWKGVKKLADEVAAITSGQIPGDIENLINAAFIMYDQDKEGKALNGMDRKLPKFGNIQLDCLYCYINEAIERARVGEPRPVGKEIFQTERNDGSRSSVAVHEVGHALVEILCSNKPFEKITSLPRGNSLGYVMHSKKELVTRKDYEDNIRACMGGRAAEEIVYGKENVSTGAVEDIAQATSQAYRMVERWGFSEEFEFMSLAADTAVYLGESGYTCSQAFRQQSDQAARELLKRLYQDTRKMLEDKEELIKALARKVFDEEAMTGEEFRRFYDEITKQKG